MWVIVSYPSVSSWTNPKKEEFTVTATRTSSPSIEVPLEFFGLAKVSRHAIYFGHGEEGQYRIRARVKPSTSTTEWDRTALLGVQAGYPASLGFNVASASSVTYEVEGQTFSVDAAGPEFAAVLSNVPTADLAEVTARDLRRQISAFGAKETSPLVRSGSGDWFFLFVVPDRAADKVFQVIRGVQIETLGGQAGTARALVALVGRKSLGRSLLVVIDPALAPDAPLRDRGFPERKVTVGWRQKYDKNVSAPTDGRGTALEKFADLHGAQLALLRIAVEEGYQQEVPFVPKAILESEASTGSMLSRIREVHASRSMAILATPGVGTIEEGMVDSSHVLVDIDGLTRVARCADLIVPSGEISAVSSCTSIIQAHATEVYGLMSAVDPTLRGVGAVSCAPGGAPLMRHLNVAVPPEIESTIAAAQRLGDIMRWMSGLPPKHPEHANWPSLQSIGAEPVRVINISRRFDAIGVGSTTTVPAWHELAMAIENVTTQSFAGKGAVVVLIADNAGNIVSEFQLSLPCRNSLVIVTASDGISGSVPAPTINCGPPVSVSVPSRNVDLLGSSGGGLCRSEPGVFTSYAAPVASTAAALVAHANPSLSAPEIAAIIRETARVVDGGRSGVGRWVQLNSGRTQMEDPNPMVSPIEGSPASQGGRLWFSLWYGHGVVDIQGAVDRALGI